MQRKAKTKMGEIHHRYVWYDGSSKQSGGRQTPISQRRLDSDVLTRRRSIMVKDRWKEYFDKSLNKENPRSKCADAVSNEGLTQWISRDEVKVALSRLRKVMATGMHGIPEEMYMYSDGRGYDSNDLRAGENDNVVAMYCDCIYLKRNERHPEWCWLYKGVPLHRDTIYVT